jgi:RNAse (barnase) inhibitor barstar
LPAIIAFCVAPVFSFARGPQGVANLNVGVEDLPKEVRSTLALINKAARFLTSAMPSSSAVDLHVFKFDLGHVRGKLAMLAGLAKALRFSDYFGKNWDALNDCVTDLSWLDGNGWVLILVNGKSVAQGHEEVFHNAIEIRSLAAEHWCQNKKTFWVFIQAQADWDCGLPKIVGE